jgi:phage gpG-like protein
MANIDDVRAKLADLDPILKIAGEIALEQTQLAFVEKEWDGRAWDEHYPSQPPPFMHVAGAISDLLGGTSIKEERTTRNRGSLLQDSGNLIRSLQWWPAGENAVEIGSDKTTAPYASVHNFGLKSDLPITQEVVDGLRDFLKERPEYWPHLGFIAAYRKDETTRPRTWSQGVVKRQFVGVTSELMDDLVEAVTDWLEEDGIDVAR